MNPRGHRSISVFLVFCLLVLSANLYAKERRGADIIVTKTDGNEVTGELITVKPESILLQDRAGVDISVEIKEIIKVKIVKKSKWGVSGLIGLGIGAVSGGIIVRDEDWRHIGVAIGGLAGGLIGVIGGASAGADKTIRQGQLSLLRKYARIRNFQ